MIILTRFCSRSFLVAILLAIVSAVACIPSGAAAQSQHTPPGGCGAPAIPTLYSPSQSSDMMEELFALGKGNEATACVGQMTEGSSVTQTITALSESAYYGRLRFMVIGQICQLVHAELYLKNGQTTCVGGCPQLSDAMVAKRYVNTKSASSPANNPPVLKYVAAQMSDSLYVAETKKAITGTCAGNDICKTFFESVEKVTAFYSAFHNDSALEAGILASYTGNIPNPVCYELTTLGSADPQVPFCNANYGLPNWVNLQGPRYSAVVSLPFAVGSTPANSPLELCYESGEPNTFALDPILLHGPFSVQGSMNQPVKGY